MGVEKIKAFSIIGRVDSLDTVTLVLGKSGVFQPDDVKSFYSNTRGFTRVSSGNPYSEPVGQRYRRGRLTGGVNYIRNSVKCTVDAYDFTVGYPEKLSF